jgi:hypothetical protein
METNTALLVGLGAVLLLAVVYVATIPPPAPEDTSIEDGIKIIGMVYGLWA